MESEQGFKLKWMCFENPYKSGMGKFGKSLKIIATGGGGKWLERNHVRITKSVKTKAKCSDLLCC